MPSGATPGRFRLQPAHRFGYIQFDLTRTRREATVKRIERHRFLLYGRIGSSVVLYLVSMGFGTAAILAGTPRAYAVVVIGCLVASIVALPRRTRPSSEEAREQASDAELERFQTIRSWLVWIRVLYLLLAGGVLFGLPMLL